MDAAAALLTELANETLLQLRELAVSPAARDRRVDLARRGIAAGRTAKTLPLLAALNRALPGDAEIALLRGVALRLEQHLTEAADVFAAALARGLDDPRLLQGLAQTRYELGLPAAQLFDHARRRLPGDRDLLRNQAAAMAADGDAVGAVQLLQSALQAAPDWLDGHKALATLRWTGGDQADFAESYAAACRVLPANADLWLAWFRAHAQIRDWTTAARIIDQAQAALGALPALRVARLFVASESGDTSQADTLIAETASLQGDSINLCRVRHALRQGAADRAAEVCAAQIQGPSASLFWPYLSAAWRVLGDQRHIWFDRPDDLIQHRSIGLSNAELTELAEVLRTLHVMQQPYIEQSVRGGTQTDRSVILRHEPIIRRARAAWIEAIRDYVAGLPPPEPGHPLLGQPRGELLIEGSWSVRLLQQGYNVPHNHPVGWLSTAFYIAVPDAAALGPAPAGYIAFGTPPEELGLDLPAYRLIEPQVGRTAIFPSTMWHRTMPFADGERLVMALDIRRPRF